MAISDEDVRKVREATDLVELVGERSPVKQKGRDFWCCCPLHQEKTPSFKMDPASQLWHCFGCGEGGDVFAFLMKTEDLTFPEAVQKLADRAHIEITQTQGKRGVSQSQKARLKEVCAETAAFYHLQLMRSKSDRAAQARSYLASRHFGGSVPKTWNLGFAPGMNALVRHLSGKGFTPQEMIAANVALSGRDGKLRDRFYDRVMFPINNAQGECIAFGGRVMEKKEPKYLNSQDTPLFHKSQVLYGLDKAKSAMTSTGTAVVVEGYTDVISLHEHGIANVVATLGTALTMQHIRMLSRHAGKRIVYLFDGDAAGQRAADRALSFIDASMTPEAGKSRIQLTAVTLPDNLDPAEFVEQRGADALNELIDQATPLIEYGIERRLAQHTLETAEGRTRALTDALSVLAPIKDSLLAKDYAIQLATRLRQRETDVLAALAALTPPRPYQQQSEPVAQTQLTTHEQAQTRRQIPAPERNRLHFEREFLSLCAQNPQLALRFADSLAQIQWHDETHAMLATSMLNTFAENEQVAPASVISKASELSPHAPQVLTSALALQSSDPEGQMAYLAEELSLGDAEDAVAALRADLSAGPLDPAEAQLLHATVTAMQKDLASRRKAHRLPLE